MSSVPCTAAGERLFTAEGSLHKSPMNFRFLVAAGAAAGLAGCAVPNGQIRNGRFVSDDHGSLRVMNRTISFNLRDLPPGSRVKNRTFYRLLPDRVIDLDLRFGDD